MSAAKTMCQLLDKSDMPYSSKLMFLMQIKKHGSIVAGVPCFTFTDGSFLTLDKEGRACPF